MKTATVPFISFATTLCMSGLTSKAVVTAASPSLHPVHDASSNDTFARVTISDTASVRYRNPGALCETTPGVQSLVGFVDLNNETGGDGTTSSYFYWFTEARNNADKAPLTIWLNGGPGADSLLGFFGEVGPCKVAADLNTTLNPYSWSEVSNMLFLSQPLGVGLSYQSAPGSGSSSRRGTEAINGRNQTRAMPATPAIDTSEKAATVTWDVLQAFMQALPALDPVVQTRTVHIWTESYGGHYGPAFFRYFHEMNEEVKNGSAPGLPLDLGTLGIGNGIIDALAQFPMYSEFVANNTYNITLVPDEVSRYMSFACRMPNGCIDQARQCRNAYAHGRQSTSVIARCAEATYMCRDNVEGPYYYYSGRNMYDIRRPENDPIIPQDFVRFLNLASTRAALGIDSIPELAAVPYAWQSEEVYNAFARSGDYIYPAFLGDLEYLLEHGIRVILIHGDADYIANWFGGEAVSLALNYSQSFLFRATPYTPLVLDDGGAAETDLGKVREHGNLSFAVVYGAGHFVPFYKPDLALEMFRRAVANLDLPTGRGPTSSAAVPFVPDSPLSATSP